MTNTTPYQPVQAEKWRLLTAVERADKLKNACDELAQLTGVTDKALRAFAHLLNQAGHIDESAMLVGATGESNELYNQARGKTLIVGTDNAEPLPVLVQLLAALLTGNQTVVYYPTQAEFVEKVVAILYKESGLVTGVLDIDHQAEFDSLLNDKRLAQVGVVGTVSEVQALSSVLSKTDAILTQVIAITDQKTLSEVFDPEYLHRFSTERVRTINTTAIGGNASLLELGIGEH